MHFKNWSSLQQISVELGIPQANESNIYWAPIACQTLLYTLLVSIHWNSQGGIDLSLRTKTLKLGVSGKWN